MKPVVKYQVMTAAVVVLFLYLFATEVPERWRETSALYDDLQAKEQESPELLLARKLELQARQRRLASELTGDSGRFEQSETGVVEFLNATARKSGVRFSSLTPIASPATGQLREIGFSLLFESDFHSAGRFVNEMEEGGILTRVVRIEITTPPKRSSRLGLRIEGVAYIIPPHQVM